MANKHFTCYLKPNTYDFRGQNRFDRCENETDLICKEVSLMLLQENEIQTKILFAIGILYSLLKSRLEKFYELNPESFQTTPCILFHVACFVWYVHK